MSYDRTMSTAVRERTRTAILHAAIRVLSQNRSAGFRDIAAEAGVARSTVHRYFADRAALLAGLAGFVDEEYERVVRESRLEEDSGLEAMLRLATGLVDRLDVFGWWLQPFDDDATASAEPASDTTSEPGDLYDPQIDAVVARGHDDGSIDSQLPSVWINTLLWSMLYSVNALYQHVPMTLGEARAHLLRTMEKSLRSA